VLLVGSVWGVSVVGAPAAHAAPPPSDSVPVAPVPHDPATLPVELPPSDPVVPRIGAPTSEGEPQELSTVQGAVWLDRDRDGTRTADEWGIARVTVVLVRAGSTAAVPPSRLEGTAEPSPDPDPAQRTTTTAPDGSYRFDDVLPGDYVVTAGVSIDGVGPLGDAWSAMVRAAAGAPVLVDFRGVGQGALAGDIGVPARDGGGADVSVWCRWAGSDGLVGTADDAAFTSTADPTGRFDLLGLPFGTYTCAAVEGSTGRAGAATVATVSGPDVVEAPISAPAGADVVVTTAPASSTLLPATGGPTVVAGRLGVASIVAGLATMGVARFRRRHQR
jgi:hypothetical protein